MIDCGNNNQKCKENSYRLKLNLLKLIFRIIKCLQGCLPKVTSWLQCESFTLVFLGMAMAGIQVCFRRMYKIRNVRNLIVYVRVCFRHSV